MTSYWVAAIKTKKGLRDVLALEINSKNPAYVRRRLRLACAKKGYAYISLLGGPLPSFKQHGARIRHWGL